MWPIPPEWWCGLIPTLPAILFPLWNRRGWSYDWLDIPWASCTGSGWAPLRHRMLLVSLSQSSFRGCLSLHRPTPSLLLRPTVAWFGSRILPVRLNLVESPQASRAASTQSRPTWNCWRKILFVVLHSCTDTKKNSVSINVYYLTTICATKARRVVTLSKTNLSPSLNDCCRIRLIDCNQSIDSNRDVRITITLVWQFDKTVKPDVYG